MKTVIVLIISLSLLGCASDMDDSTRTKVEGTAVGALIGAAIGGMIGGRDGALIGAAVGAGGGFIAGNEVAKRKAQYATTEDFLDAEIQNVAAYNQEAKKYNQKLVQEVKSLKTKVARLEKQYRQGKVERDVLLAERAKVRKKLQSSQRALEDLQKEYEINLAILDEQKKERGANDAYVKKLKKEVAALKKNIEQLQDSSQQLAAIDQRLSV